MERTVSETSPPPPSERVIEAQGSSGATRALARELQGDLDNIVLKAMHRDTERRYSSAAALSQDIQNYLDGLPIRARPDTFTYRAGKFLRRNAIEVAGVLAVCALIATLVTFYTVRLAAERDAAQRERQTATTIAEFMTDVFRRANPNETQGNTVTVREALDAASRRIDNDLADQPRLRFTLMRNMSQAYNGLGLWEHSRDLMERAVAHERATFGNGGIELARSLQALGDIYNNLNRFEDADRAFEEALATRLTLGIDADAETIILLSSRGTNLRARQRYTEAIEQHRRAETLARALSPPDPEVLGKVLWTFSTTWSEAGDQQKAEAYSREALPLLKGVTGEGHDMYANVLASLANTLRRQYKLEEAEKFHRELLTLQTRQVGANHRVLGRGHNNFGNLLRAKGDYAGAEKALMEALRIHRLQAEPDPLDLAIAHHNLGAIYHEWEKLDGSLTQLAIAIDMKRKAAGPRGPQVVSSLLEKASVLRELGRLEEANAAFGEAQSIASERFDKNDRRHTLLLLEQARLHLASGAKADAERDLTEAVAQLRKQDDPAKLAEAISSLGDAQLAAAKPAEARAAFEESLNIRRAVLPAGHKAITETESRLAGFQ
jgi:eukaryotic-like serine/threonine-protein kinase